MPKKLLATLTEEIKFLQKPERKKCGGNWKELWVSSMTIKENVRL